MTNAGGPAIICADACDAAGLRIEPLADARARGSPRCCRRGLDGQPGRHDRRRDGGGLRALDAVALADDARRRGRGDLRPPLAARADEVARGDRRRGRGRRPARARGLAAAATRPRPPTTVGAGLRDPRGGGPGAAPAPSGRARAARAPPDPPFEPPTPTGDRGDDRRRGLAEGAGWLAPADVGRLLRCWGIPRRARAAVGSAHAAGRAAVELGGPVALKAIAPGLVHKSDAGGVRLGLRRAGRGRARRARDCARLEAAGTTVEGFLVQRMVPEGVELLVGVVGDPAFGPVVACGAGGVAVELLGDVAVRLAPVGARDADGMLRGAPDLPAARRLPRRAARRRRRAARHRPARRRARGRASRDRGARPQPRHRHAARRARRRRARPRRGARSHAGVPLAQRLITAANYGARRQARRWRRGPLRVPSETERKSGHGHHEKPQDHP